MQRAKLNFKKVLFLVALCAVTMSIGSATLLADQMYLEVNDAWGWWDVKAESIDYNDDGTLTLNSPWHIQNGDGDYQGSARNPGKFGWRGFAKIVINGNELRLIDSETFNVSVYNLDGRCVYSVNAQTEIAISKNVLPNDCLSGFYLLRVEKGDGKFENIKLMITDDAVSVNR